MYFKNEKLFDSLNGMTAGSLDWEWIPEAVAKLMHANGIHDRSDLAQALKGVMGQGTVYRTFSSASWSGKATTRMLSALSQRFHIPLPQLVAMLVADPILEQQARRPKVGATRG